MSCGVGLKLGQNFEVCDATIQFLNRFAKVRSLISLGYSQILEVLPGGPSDVSGKISCGDILTHVDSFCLQDLAFSDVIKLFSGREGSEVVLTVKKQGMVLLGLSALCDQLMSIANTGADQATNVRLIRGEAEKAGVGMKLERSAIRRLPRIQNHFPYQFSLA